MATRIAAVLVALVMTPLIAVAVLAGASGSDDLEAQSPCVRTGPLPELDTIQAANARTIIAVAQQMTAQNPERTHEAELVALITAYQESKLHNLANVNVSGSESIAGADGTGSDHDSVGLFQQRASWGTIGERMNPTFAARAFLTRLLGVPAWRSLPPCVAAQQVQVSAVPDAYASWVRVAERWIEASAIGGRTVNPSCGGSGLTVKGSAALPRGFQLPVGTSTRAAQAVSFALAQLGKPYAFGASGPGAYDCSGLTMAAWAAAGIRLPHYTVSQATVGTAVASLSLLQAGDLIFIPGDDGTIAIPGHVGMYVGSQLVIEAPETGDVVKTVPLISFRPVAALRHVP